LGERQFALENLKETGMGEEARFVARYASVYVRGNTFAEVGDVLAERGFDMVRATQTERGVLVIPHSQDNRQAAHLFAQLDPVEAAVKEDVEPKTNGKVVNGSKVEGCVCSEFRTQYASGVWPLPNWFCKVHGQVDVSGGTAPPTDPDARAEWAIERVKLLREEAGNPEPMSVELASATLAGDKVLAGVDDTFPLTSCECGAVHPEGMVCLIPIFIEKKCCLVTTYGHNGPHEAADAEGVITHRWIEELVITDLPFNAYGPGCDDVSDGNDE
jgi:hypothetical protein